MHTRSDQTPRPAADVDGDRILQSQRDAFRAGPYPSPQARMATLAALEKVIIDHQEEIATAVSRDFGHRSAHETRLLEIFPAVAGLAAARRHLSGWMKPRRRSVSLWFAGGRNRVIPQPKGVVGIAAPWNYPLFLVVSPLTSALAAGNRCMIKMAANSQRLCRLLRRRVGEVIPEDRVAFLPGIPGEAFTALPFDHLIFTGSPRSGRTVMRAAARNLTPVTLELGGKSPAIVAGDFDIATAAERILYVKYMNAGQTCVAPDYLLLPADRQEAFVRCARRIVPARYPRLDSPDYTAIIDSRAYDRLISGLEDAGRRGATVVSLLPGARPDPQTRRIPPTLVLNATDEMRLMREEIFGPILPVRTYRRLEAALATVNAGERPLALYLFTNDDAVRRKVIYGTLSGGVTVNDCAIHVAQHDLPFGGIGNSGMGQYHGREGFLEFSKLRPVFRQSAFPATRLLYPPYGKTFSMLYRWMIRLRGL